MMVFNMVKVLAFDVSETLQTGAEHNDGGLGQPMRVGNDIIPGAYSVMVGGRKTAELLKEAQAKGLVIVLVTNNGADLDKEVISRTLGFLKNYGIVIPEEQYMGPPKGSNGSKVPRLEEILIRFNVSKEEVLFFDDSLNNVEEARSQQFKAIRVKSPEDLQKGIMEAINTRSLKQETKKAPSISPGNAGLFSNTEWAQFDAEFKSYFSEMTRPVRVEFFNHINTPDYWNTLEQGEKTAILQEYLHKKSRTYDTLPDGFRAYLSEVTQSIRHNMSPKPTNEAFWNGLDELSKDQYLQGYQQTNSFSIK